jgi:hypothetical protein
LVVVLPAEAMLCHCQLVWPCEADVPMVLFHLMPTAENAAHIRTSLSQVVLQMLTETEIFLGRRLAQCCAQTASCLCGWRLYGCRVGKWQKLSPPGAESSPYISKLRF